MQTLASSRAASARAARPARTPVRCSAGPAPSRRSFAAGLLALPALLVTRPALALIPDDEDEELLARTKSARSSKIVQDKEEARAFAAAEGFVSGGDVVALQTAVNALSKTGALLAADKLDEAKTLASGAWVASLKRTVAASGAGEAPAAAAALTAALSSLPRSSSLAAAKTDYVAAVGAFKKWVVAAGLATKLTGI